ncbi:class F sortase [Thermomonospora umbrina]|uniref:Sortase family protein n=1 Tax=Thermomonospora umbrina TaxID=111806 RepID=A0A3D9T1G0_9ACTN|nr:class F sortase [Thermomonospora umbrina]REF00154.1 sortase family protein [Thermomonospora umbrina]
MAVPSGGRALTAIGLAVLVAVAAGGTRGSDDRPPERRYDGPRALWHIPDGASLPASDPVRVEIPRLGVRASVMEVGKNPDGTVEVPPLRRAELVGWYRHGPAPGSRGSAVLLGHYDDLRGPAAFHRLGGVRRGDVVLVPRRDRTVARFRVDATERVRKTGFPARRVYGSVRYAGLRLVTCGGAYDRRERSYRDNLIVHAHLVGVSP